MTRMRLRAEFIADDEERALWLRDLEELDRIADSAIRLVREEVEDLAREPIDAAQVAASIVRGVERRRPEIYADAQTRALARTVALAPGIYRRLFDGRVRKVQRSS